MQMRFSIINVPGRRMGGDSTHSPIPFPVSALVSGVLAGDGRLTGGSDSGQRKVKTLENKSLSSFSSAVDAPFVSRFE